MKSGLNSMTDRPAQEFDELQTALSARLSRGFALMAARAKLRRERRQEAVGAEKVHKTHSGCVDDFCVCSDGLCGDFVDF